MDWSTKPTHIRRGKHLASRGEPPAGFWFGLQLLLCLLWSGALSGCQWWDRDPGPLVWEIGRPDRHYAEFALAPNHYRDFEADGLYVIGQSDSRTDWPYVHPGPGDLWAGRRPHTFTILFGTDHPPNSGRCRLRLQLMDTHRHNPPKLQVAVNGHTLDRELSAGGGDASLKGEPHLGKTARVKIDFPVSWLRRGDNEIRITTRSGSWLLYDWIGFYGPEGLQVQSVGTRSLVREIVPLHRLQEEGSRRVQPIRFGLRHFGEPTSAILHMEGIPPVTVMLRQVNEDFEVLYPAIQREKKVRVTVEVGGAILENRQLVLKPVRPLTVFIVPHSHTDVGYTENQQVVADRQVDHLRLGLEYANKTAHYPEGARFVWNAEVLWAVDLYLQRSSPSQQAAFFKAVKEGRVALNGMFLNTLTGLCRPEELLRLFRDAARMAEAQKIPIDSAMHSDIPGCTWGTVTALAQAGIKYFSAAPNHFDRIGDILVQGENRPFYWLSPSGREKVLVWIPYKGYALSHLIRKLTPQWVEQFQARLAEQGYPYDLAYIRWSGVGDNDPPDPSICEFVKDWNARTLSPRFRIASVSTAFRALEERYGSRLPRVSGDWTPYWEDGAGSSARETALHRAASDRLAQAETLWAMTRPGGYPVQAYEEAWRSVLLFSEHTWGADESISNPESQKTREQWEIKRSYALRADRQSRDLLAEALKNRGSPISSPAASSPPHLPGGLDVFNTCSWPRTELVTLPKDFPAAGDRVIDDRGRPVPSQRLGTGELVFLAREIPPLAGKRYWVTGGAPQVEGKALAGGAVLENETLRVRVDEKTGGIVDLRSNETDGNLVDTASGHALNDYLYLPGDDPAGLRRNGPVTLRVKEKGPLVASLVVESGAPGCRRLEREVRLTAGMDTLELINTVDKDRLEAKSYYSREGKESVNFAFPFRVAGGRIRLDIPWAVMRPELDQLPGSCKNWLTVGRWADVSNDRQGVTWIPLDAPLVQIGGLTATLLNSQTDPKVWRKKIEPTQRIYSWVMNNHWGTNYRAYQEGPVVFRYWLRPHRGFDPAGASRLAIGASRPLLAVAARGPAPVGEPLLRLTSDEVLVSSLKPADDGRAWIIRLFGAGGRTVRTRLSWGSPGVQRVWLSDTSEKAKNPVEGAVEVPAYGLVTLRVERDAVRR